MKKLPRTVTLSQLKHHLITRGVPVRNWKGTSTKTLGQLHQNVRSGAAEIVLYEPGESGTLIELHVSSVVIDVMRVWDEKGSLMKLQESTRRLGGKEWEPRTTHSVSAKILPNELPQNAAARCLRAKLGLKMPVYFVETGASEAPIDSINRFKRETPPKSECCILTKVHMYELPDDDPESCPGLETLRDLHLFACEVPESLSDPGRFTRRYGSKHITYTWVQYEKHAGSYIFEPRSH